ncbi:MAG: hypothetical protein ACYC6Y_04270 [Thermoguttaceae bacterium]
MNRTLIVAVIAAVGGIGTAAEGQSWMFQPGTYSQGTGSGAQTPSMGVAPASQSSGAVQGPVGTNPGPRAYATFTESQAAEAAKLPKPAFQWDPTGVFGRAMRYQNWMQQESIEAGRLRAYSAGVRDAVGAPVWTWGPGAVHPLPRIVAPTDDSSGKRRSPGTP